MAASLLLLSAVALVVEVNPLEKFRENRAATKAQAVYVETKGRATLEDLAKLRTWVPVDMASLKEVKTDEVSRWACDGKAERITSFLRNPESSSHFDAFLNSSGDSLDILKHRPSTSGIDVLWDGVLQAEQRLEESDVQIHHGDVPGMSLGGVGPNIWWGTFRFPSSLKDGLDPNPVVQSATIGGFPTIVEVYTQSDARSWYRVEVFYDPKVGYLPRYARAFGVAEKFKICKEYYLIDVRPCASGGFVPIEFCCAGMFECRTLEKRGTDFIEPIEAIIPAGPILLTYTKAKSFKDFNSVNALDQLGLIKQIAAPGGSISKGSTTSLSLPVVRSKLGTKLDARASGKSSFDEEELNRYSQPPKKTDRTTEAAIVAVVLAVAVGVLIYRRRRQP